MASDTVSLAGFEVPRIGLGTLYITEQRGFGRARADAIALLREAAGLGVRLFDTADSYGSGAAEEALRRALHPYDGLLIATKGGFRHERLHAWVTDATPERLVECVDASLARLGIETIDLYQLHCPDRRVPYAEAVGALAMLQREGKIRHIGISNVDEAELAIARAEAEIVSVQNPCNIRRGWRSGVIEACESAGIAFLPWMPLGDGSIAWDDPALVRIAAKHAATPAQIALAALLHCSPVMLPIPGTGSIAHLGENVAAGDLRLDDEDLALIWPDFPGASEIKHYFSIT